MKDFEEDKKGRDLILSLLRMPISPLRLTEGLEERNTFQMRQSTRRRIEFLRTELTSFGAIGKQNSGNGEISCDIRHALQEMGAFPAEYAKHPVRVVVVFKQLMKSCAKFWSETVQ